MRLAGVILTFDWYLIVHQEIESFSEDYLKIDTGRPNKEKEDAGVLWSLFFPRKISFNNGEENQSWIILKFHP